MPRTILIVEDNDLLRSMLSERIALEDDFATEEAANLCEAERKLSAISTHYDAILLDVGLPDGDGHEFCAQLRQDGRTMPVIMLTGRDSEDDVVRGLDAGANDYLVKPFRHHELLARLRAQLRAFDKSADAVFSIGPYVFRPTARELIDRTCGRRLMLTGKEVEILTILCRAGQGTVSRHALLDKVWGYHPSMDTHTLETHIYRLRQKIEEIPAAARLLVTEPGGYKLNTNAA